MSPHTLSPPYNVGVLLRIYLTLIITNCRERDRKRERERERERERDRERERERERELFFQLKLIKDEHRSTMSQNRLVHLTTQMVMRRINSGNILLTSVLQKPSVFGKVQHM